MGYVPQFDNDIFISYRRVSNDGRDKWVDAFCEQLRVQLAELVGDISIWRDLPKIHAGDEWRKEISDALNSTAIFLAIISGTYFDSDQCLEELDQFLGCISTAGETRQRRIVPILKQPTTTTAMPPDLAEFNFRQFFEFRPKGTTEHFEEFKPDPADNTAPLFASTLAALAQDLRAALLALKGIAKAQALGTIYLAEVGPELHAEREKVRSDLVQRSYNVLPERRYLWNSSSFGQTIAAHLGAADLSVHLVARMPSKEPSALERAKTQLDLAVEAMARHGKPAPLVWVQPASKADPAAQTLIDYIERELSNKGVEYSEGSLEDFKTQIYDLLPKPPAAAIEDVALIVEEGDLLASGALVDLLVTRLNLEPVRVQFSGAGPKDPEALGKALKRCRRCIVFWGIRDESWLTDLLASEALASHVGNTTTCVHVAAPPSVEKDTFRTSRARVVRDGGDAGGEAALRDFLTAKAVR